MREERLARTEWERDSNAIGLGSCWDQLEPAAVGKLDPRAKAAMQHVVKVPRGHFHHNHDFLHSSADEAAKCRYDSATFHSLKLLQQEEPNLSRSWLAYVYYFLGPYPPCRLGDRRTLCLAVVLPKFSKSINKLSLSRTTRISENHWSWTSGIFWDVKKEFWGQTCPSLARTLPVAKLPETITSLASSSSRVAPLHTQKICNWWCLCKRHHTYF